MHAGRAHAVAQRIEVLRVPGGNLLGRPPDTGAAALDLGDQALGRTVDSGAMAAGRLGVHVAAVLHQLLVAEVLACSREFSYL